MGEGDDQAGRNLRQANGGKGRRILRLEVLRTGNPGRTARRGICSRCFLDPASGIGGTIINCEPSLKISGAGLEGEKGERADSINLRLAEVIGVV